MNGIRLAGSSQLQLLLHERATDPAIRATFSNQLRRSLAEAERSVASATGRAAWEDARSTTLEYLGTASSRGEGSETAFALALSALERLADVNEEQGKSALDSAAQLDRAADILGLAIGLLSLGLLWVSSAWVRLAVISPLISLSDAIRCFAAGDHDVRMAESGAEELRTAAAGFNSMASTPAKQQGARLTFLAGVAHDLRNPLAALQMSSAAIKPNEPLPSEERIRQILGIVRRQVTRLNRMVGDLLEAT